MTVEARPWWPHIYILRCVVNEAQLGRFAELRGCDTFSDPHWLRDLRRTLSASTEDIEALRARMFVKVGSTYGRDPAGRIDALTNWVAPKTTLMCRSVPVVGWEVLCFIPGEEELEKLLHWRWRADRIDPLREFFWCNEEIAETIACYAPPGGMDALSAADRVALGLPLADDVASKPAPVPDKIAAYAATLAPLGLTVEDPFAGRGRGRRWAGL